MSILHLAQSESLSDFRIRCLEVLKPTGIDLFSLHCPTLKMENGVLSNFPTDFFLRYRERQYAENDRVLAHCLQTPPKPIYNSIVESYLRQSPLHLEESETNLQIFNLYQQYDIFDVYHWPERMGCGLPLVISLAQHGNKNLREIIEASEGELSYICDNIHYIAATRYSQYFFKGVLESPAADMPSITQKQKELLQLLASSNLNLQGVARSMHVSLDTANKHIAAAKAVLGAKTQACAIYRGIMWGVIELGNEKWVECAPPPKKPSPQLTLVASGDNMGVENE